MIKINVEQLKSLYACEAGIVWFTSQKRKALKTIIPALIKDNHFDYAKWLISHLLTREQNQLWAINSAKSVLPIFEKKYPNDPRPKQAIETAEKFIHGKCPIDELRLARNYAATYAAYAATDAYAYATYAATYAAYAADAATDAATYAAYAATYAAYAATDAYATYAADAATDAATYATYAATYAAAYAASKKIKTQIEICNFALKLLGEIK